MNTIYLSGPITGHRFFRIKFALAELRLKAEGYNVINPARINARLPKSTTYTQYMNISIELLKMASVIYMLKGWEKSNGANIEYSYAFSNKIKILKEIN